VIGSGENRVSVTASSPAERIGRSAVASYPGVEHRLLAGVSARESLDAYLAAGGYAPLGDPQGLLADVVAAGLRGRGGAAFPLDRKLAAVSAASAPGSAPVVVANGEEGEPASVKDRWLMRHRPHLVLDGLRLAGALVGADDVHAYVADRESADSLEAAAAELTGRGLWDAGLVVTVVAPGYVAGEETALVRAVNGGPALPTDKPPRPFEAGIGGRPTLVSNVETLANLPLLHRFRVAADRWPGEPAPGTTFLLTLTGCSAAGLYEVPFGVTLREVLAWRGEDPDGAAGFVMGGYFGGLLGPRALDIPLDDDELRLGGSGLGCGAISVVPRTDCPLRLASALMTYFAVENAGQCGSCFNGTAAMRVVLDALREHRAGPPEVDRLRYLSAFLPGRGACGTLDGAAAVGASLLREFPGVVEAHVGGRCEVCASPVDVPGPPFAVEPPSAR
jgi:NADH:ubiquinone oxidoreductase subunit F (NADH-binding)